MQQIILKVVWVFIHLLQFCVSNQTLDAEEDLKNKPWRPIPSGRISLRSALFLRWTLIPLCLLFSIVCGVLSPSVLFLAATIAYNELRLGAHWFLRNVLNAVGYASFSFGATGAGCSGTPLQCENVCIS